MHVVRELEARIEKSRALLALEIDHQQRVIAAGLDARDAQLTIDRRCRHIASLELQHDRVLVRRLAVHQAEPGFSVPPIVEVDISHEPIPAHCCPRTNG